MVNLPPVLVIPAYQPDNRFAAFVQSLRAHFPRIVVVDDGSSADRQPTFAEIAALPGVTLLRHARNLGKGTALKTAFNHVLVTWPEAPGVVTADADGQHRAEDILAVANALARNPKAIVMGVRQFRGEVPFRSRFGNELTKFVFRFLLGRRLSDTQSGLRGIPRVLLGDLLTLRSRRYEFELDMLVIAVQKQFAIEEVKIATIYEAGNKSSHFNPIRDSLRIYFVFFRFIFTSLVTFLTDITVFTLTFWSAHSLFASVVAGRVVALAVSLIGSKVFVFRSERKISEVLPRFLALWASLLLISYGLTYGLVERFGANAYVARIVVDTALLLFNFSVQRNLIFASPADAEVETEDPSLPA